MKSLFLLLLAASALDRTDASQQGMNPISRVVQLLEGLVEKIEADGKVEEDLFDKFVCWYKTVVEAKTASNAAAKDRVESLEAYIADIEAGRIEFTSERADLEAAIKKLHTEIEAATDLREKEHEDYLAAKDEMEKAIAALEQAVEVLDSATSEHKGSMLSVHREAGQLKEGMHSVAAVSLQRVLQLGRDYLAKDDAEFLERLLTGDVPSVDWKKLNRKATFKMKYKARSGKIQKILADMLQTFNDNLADATAKEEEARATYEKLMASKKSELETAQEALVDQNKETGERAMNKEQAQQEVDDLKAQIEADEGFISDTEETYQQQLEAYKERKRLRVLEIESISKAISILHSDDARDTFKKSFESQGYLFIQRRTISRLQRQASAAVREAGSSAHDPRLSALAMQVLLHQGGHFDEVIAAIDKMVANLQAEEAEDLKNKETCEEERMEQTKEAKDISRKIDDATESIAREKQKIEEMKVQIKEKEAEIKKLEEDLATAARQREDEKMAYEASSADDHAAAELIKKAIKVLEGFYSDNGLVLVQKKARQPPTVEAGKAPPPPPPMPTEPYGGAKGESTGIIAILGMILEDVESDIAKANEEEKRAVKEFEKMKEDTKAAIEAANKAVALYKSDIAQCETEIEEHTNAKADAKKTLDAVMEQIKAAEPGCDFVAVNFQVRSKNRQLEIDGLHKAKAILQGAAFSKPPDANREIKPGDAM